MKINISGVLFDGEVGKRLLKLKYENCPFSELEKEWDDIEVGTLASLGLELKNSEQRRVAFQYFDMDRIARETPAELVSRETIVKKTSWLMPDGSLQEQTYEEVYCLYSIHKEILGVPHSLNDDDPFLYYAKFSDPFTDREHLLWVDGKSVAGTNGLLDDDGKLTSKINAIQAIAWTITTDIEEGGIDCIVRQGDCTLLKRNERASKYFKRHLTEYEYRTLPILKG